MSIRVSMADANAVSTEALRNIRTVRSFGADLLESWAWNIFPTAGTFGFGSQVLGLFLCGIWVVIIFFLVDQLCATTCIS